VASRKETEITLEKKNRKKTLEKTEKATIGLEPKSTD
jgi:hypothetical protein